MGHVVHVLLATYNGARHLAEQWASIEAQQGVRVVLHLADDGSADGTPQLLEQLAARRCGAVIDVQWLHAPPRRSATGSFMLLLAQAVQRFPDLDWLAFSDQDDVWLPGKLERAIATLADAPPGQPALYGARTLIVDEDNRELVPSELFRRAPCFRNAVAQSIMGGNTMVLNGAAARLVAGSAAMPLQAHDWFSYQLVSGAGGKVHYDPQPFVRYRQHGSNEVGSNIGWRATLNRLRRMFLGRHYTRWNDKHVAALRARADALTPANRATLEAFHQARHAALPWTRLAWLRRSGVFRQPGIQQFILWLGCMARRI
jgi:glycosyltransferase involved in cell wall biosynthesis